MTIETERRYSVNPSEIDASKHLWDAFGHRETEISAGYIIRMLQEVGEWKSFTEEEIEEFYQRSGHTGFSFNGLVIPARETLFDGRTHQVGGGFVNKMPDGSYEVTEEFVNRAYEASPKKV